MRSPAWLAPWALKLRVGREREILKDEKDPEVRKLVATIKFLMDIKNDKRKWLFGGASIGGDTAEFFISSGTKFLKRLTKTIK
jgi:hypothetical protein